MNKILFGALVISSSFVATAAYAESSSNWVGGVSYANLSDEEDGLDYSLGALVGSLGYKIDSGSRFHFIPEVRVGVGITDDTVTVFGVNVNLELDSFLALSVKGQYELENGIYLFAAPTYTNAEFTASASQGGTSASVTEDSWEFGFGVGAGYSFNSSTSLEASYEQFDGIDVLSIGLRFDF